MPKRPPAAAPTAVADRPRRPAAGKDGLHPRNRHRGRYDFPRLIAASPELAGFVRRNAHGDESIDFADPAAVRALNRALLTDAWGIVGWDLAAGWLCPPIPGRADYLHRLADLLAADHDGAIPRGAAVRVLDIGCGANCIYPLIGHGEYGWHCVGSDIDRDALAAAAATLAANPAYAAAIELRLQPSRQRVFAGVVGAGERFALTLCNPPFHASPADARAGSMRKWRQLGRKPGKSSAAGGPTLNFGGRLDELCCPGGEAGFVGRMIAESAAFAGQCGWFSSLLSKESNLPAIERALQQAGVRERRVLAMAQGHKRSRLVAWTFLDAAGRRQCLADASV